MNKIGFIHFRRFKELQPMEYRGITFLVGRNNAGKSTVVKALLLLNDFFKSNQIKHFSFGNKVLEDTNVVTFGRARNRSTTGDIIKFDWTIGKYEINIIITGEDDKTQANVVLLQIHDTEYGLEFLFTPKSSTVDISRRKRVSESVMQERVTSLYKIEEELKKLKQQIDQSDLKKTSREYIELINEYNTFVSRRSSFAHDKIDTEPKNLYSIIHDYNGDIWLDDIVTDAITATSRLHDKEFKKIQGGHKESVGFSDLRGFKEDISRMRKSFEGFVDHIKSISFQYMGANPAKQSALFPIRDRNNSLAQAIHEFYQLAIEPGMAAYRFMEKWIKEFEIGDSLNISIHAGEAYEVKVRSHDIDIQLADKGMGSIQAMLLIIRLACVIHKNEKTGRKPVVVIEEPELNLHPALQSKLADLFLDVNQSYKLDFIIETHSEYLLRKSQLLVKENEFAVSPNVNPFCVLYFDKDKGPYQMNYREDGAFIEEFGTGFFDETRKIVRQML